MTFGRWTSTVVYPRHKSGQKLGFLHICQFMAMTVKSARFINLLVRDGTGSLIKGSNCD